MLTFVTNRYICELNVLHQTIVYSSQMHTHFIHFVHPKHLTPPPYRSPSHIRSPPPRIRSPLYKDHSKRRIRSPWAYIKSENVQNFVKIDFSLSAGTILTSSIHELSVIKSFYVHYLCLLLSYICSYIYDVTYVNV
jgi:hypothetical protein